MDQYNFDALEGMDLKVFERLKGLDESVMMVSERPGSRHVHQASSSSPRWEPVVDVFTGRHDVPDVAVSPNRRNCSETYGGGQPCIMKGISMIRTVDRLMIMKGILGRTGVTLHFEMDTCVSTGH